MPLLLLIKDYISTLFPFLPIYWNNQYLHGPLSWTSKNHMLSHWPASIQPSLSTLWEDGERRKSVGPYNNGCRNAKFLAIMCLLARSPWAVSYMLGQWDCLCVCDFFFCGCVLCVTVLMLGCVCVLYRDVHRGWDEYMNPVKHAGVCFSVHVCLDQQQVMKAWQAPFTFLIYDWVHVCKCVLVLAA